MLNSCRKLAGKKGQKIQSQEWDWVSWRMKTSERLSINNALADFSFDSCCRRV